MSRPQKIHPPLPFTFNQVLTAVGAGKGIVKPAVKSTAKKKTKKKI
jgi:hypothetical protein